MTPAGEDRPAPWIPAALVAIVVLGAALRIHLAGQSVFSDELSTYWIVTEHGLGKVLSLVHSNAEITPPFSFVASWLSTRIDSSPEMLRLPSLVAGTATMPIVYLIGRRTAGRDAGLVAAALTALSPFMAYYSAEARGYAVMMAFVALSTLALLTALDDPRRRWWVVFGLATAGAMYTHYTSIFVLGVQFAWLLWRHPQARRPALVATGLAVVAYLPWVTGLRNDLDSPTTDVLSALQPFTFKAVRLSLVHWGIGYPYASFGSARALPGLPALALMGAGGVVALVGLRARRPRWRPPGDGDLRVPLLFALALATPVLEAVFSAVGTNLLSTRNLAASWPYVALALAAVLTAPANRTRWVASGLVVLGFALGATKLLGDRFARPPYEQAAQVVNRNAAPGGVLIDDTAVTSPGPLSHIDPFLRGRHVIFRARQPQERTRPFAPLDPIPTPVQAGRRAARAADGAPVFLVTDAIGAAVPRGLAGYRVARTWRVEGSGTLIVRKYVKPAS